MRGMRVTERKRETERKCVRLRGEMRKTEGENEEDQREKEINEGDLREKCVRQGENVNLRGNVGD